ncbi:hypothetical protein KOR42_54890 [Thalassoglobus neptunius]|uniref:Uncharacterized protein n=1 Tax=Thalassoglobus neptunius TaxID=1938619 RepID=A0A5C5UTY6_9PLAN|nr:hypothetical protein [Thalassoglobus neptunius]TWT29811.1 hypothetical protein KOR42_54890 [Thalassoglobus neptunius]
MPHVVNSSDEDAFYVEYCESVSPYFERMADMTLDREARLQAFEQLLSRCEKRLADHRADFSHIIFTDLSEAIGEAAPLNRERNGYSDTLLQLFLAWLEDVFPRLNDPQLSSLGSAFLHLAAEPPVDTTTEKWLAKMLLTGHQQMTIIAYETRANFDDELIHLHNKWRVKICGEANCPFPSKELAYFKKQNS